MRETTAPRTNGRALRDVIRSWSSHKVFDDEFADNVAAARDTASAELDNDPRRD